MEYLAYPNESPEYRAARIELLDAEMALRRQIEARYPGAYSWAYIVQGPEIWQVEIGRNEAGDDGHDADCGGHDEGHSCTCGH